MILTENRWPKRQGFSLTFDFQGRAVGEAELFQSPRFNPQAQVVPISAQLLDGKQTHDDLQSKKALDLL
jgi:hypothetical protein